MSSSVGSLGVGRTSGALVVGRSERSAAQDRLRADANPACTTMTLSGADPPLPPNVAVKCT